MVAFTGLGIRIFAAPEEFGAAADFYEKALGLTCAARNEAAGVAIFELDCGPTLVLEQFESDEEDEEEPLDGRFTGITLAVNDVQAAYERLRERGVEFLGLPETMPWGGIMAHFCDPGGNILSLLQDR